MISLGPRLLFAFPPSTPSRAENQQQPRSQGNHLSAPCCYERARSAKRVSTGWSINNRTILNCSHFLARRYFFNSFSPKRSIHTGKLRQQHEFTNASFIILVRCHFVSPYHVDGSANNVLCRGGHFCEIAGTIAQWISSQVQLEQENSLNSLKRYPKTLWPEGSRHFERKECFWSEARPAGRRPWQRTKKGEDWDCLSSRAPSPSRAPDFEMAIESFFLCKPDSHKFNERLR